jgi:homopolymeric O-antigen transport system ATP-binding protein
VTSDAAISVESLSKRYVVEESQPTSLRERMELSLGSRRRRQASQRMVIDALTDVSFDVPEGEAFGVIGRNGAGKTTLLSILSRVTSPTSGRATIYGRVGSLLAVGTGFHPELTGRDNVFLNGTVLGMRRAEVSRRFDEIVEFSEIGEFIDIPVKRYSSGMYVRLAFSIAAHLDPDVLLLDEVLSVGDRQFKDKSHRRVEEITRDGRTVLFVSHDMSSVLSMCERTILLERGRVAFLGSTADAAERYATMTGTLSAGEREGSGEIRIGRIWLTSPAGEATVRADGPLQVAVELETTTPRDATGVTLKVGVHARRGVIAQFSTEVEPDNPLDCEVQSGTVVSCDVERFPLKPGEYWLSARLERTHEILDVVERRMSFWVVPADVHGTGVLPTERDAGVVVLPHRWQVRQPLSRAALR